MRFHKPLLVANFCSDLKPQTIEPTSLRSIRNLLLYLIVYRNRFWSDVGISPLTPVPVFVDVCRCRRREKVCSSSPRTRLTTLGACVPVRQRRQEAYWGEGGVGGVLM